ncbi:hypothetical protein Tco_0732319 [Tanacetum coccineum]
MSGKDSDQKMPTACPEALNQDATDPDHLEEKIRKERRCSEDWKKVYSTCWVIKRRVRPHTPVVPSVSHITTASETPKAIIRVPAREEQSPLLRGIMIEKHTHVREEGCQKVRTVQEDIGNLNLKSKGQVWRMKTYPSHGSILATLPSQQKKCIKDPVEIHHIKQREEESTEDFVRRFKIESRDVKGAPEVMRISGFMHGITNPELIKRLHDKIPKSVDKMWKITTAFLRGEVTAGNQERKKTFPP